MARKLEKPAPAPAEASSAGVALADVFDAVTSDRPYHAPNSLQETIELLEAGRGTHFDPALLDRFLAIAPELHHRYANREEEPRRDVTALVARYFREATSSRRAT